MCGSLCPDTACRKDLDLPTYPSLSGLPALQPAMWTRAAASARAPLPCTASPGTRTSSTGCECTAPVFLAPVRAVLPVAAPAQLASPARLPATLPACALTCPPTPLPAHSDLRKNHGKEEARARDLFYALWIPDLFMQRVEVRARGGCAPLRPHTSPSLHRHRQVACPVCKPVLEFHASLLNQACLWPLLPLAPALQANAEWSLFCPNEAPGLADCWGEEFEALYSK